MRRSVEVSVPPAEVGPVRQETDVFVLRDLKGFPALAELAHEYRVAVLAHAREIRGLAAPSPGTSTALPERSGRPDDWYCQGSTFGTLRGEAGRPLEDNGVNPT